MRPWGSRLRKFSLSRTSKARHTFAGQTVSASSGDEKTITMSPNYYFVRKGGEKFPVTVSAAPILLNNEIIGVIETFRETTPAD